MSHSFSENKRERLLLSLSLDRVCVDGSLTQMTGL